MLSDDEEQNLLRSVALQTANSILVARQQAERDLVKAKEALEAKTHELARSLALTRATLESTTDAILVTDEHSKITGWNENLVRVWNIPRALLEERDHNRVLDFTVQQFADPAATRSRVREIYDTSPPETFDLLELKDGRVFERFSKIQVVGGENVGRVWSFRDISSHRRTEEALREAAEERKRLLESEQAARAEAERTSGMKDEFLATLSHELRTPLNSIVGWSQLLRRGHSSPEDLQKGLETIERNAQIQAQLIEDLLDMSRIISGKLRLDIQPLQPISIVEAAIESVMPAAQAKGIRLEKFLDPGAGPITGDPNRMQQIIWNILSNAIKFTPKDGKVQVVLERVNSHIEISVADTGIGIAPEFLPKVFERFRQADASITRRHGGLGLGLSIVKHLMELHGGTVHAKSMGEGTGATFSLQLPVAAVHRQPNLGERAHPKTSTAPSMGFNLCNLTGLKVLVVDDEEDARILIRRLLMECHASVVTASNVDEALALLKKEQPDILISDIGMPGHDGYELLRRVRAFERTSGGKIPAIALTAFARSEDRTKALRAGFLVHVSKPVEPSELIATVGAVSGRVEIVTPTTS